MKNLITILMLAVTTACAGQGALMMSSTVATPDGIVGGRHVGYISHDTLFLENNEVGMAVFGIWKDTPSDQMRRYLSNRASTPTYISLYRRNNKTGNLVIIDTIRYHE